MPAKHPPIRTEKKVLAALVSLHRLDNQSVRAREMVRLDLEGSIEKRESDDPRISKENDM